MKSAAASEITLLLKAWDSGDRSVEHKLWPLVLVELRRLARRHMANERPDHTLQSNALVNEAFLRFSDWKGARFENRSQFFAMCARMMRQVLVDHARTRRRKKRGGKDARVALDNIAIVSGSNAEQLLALEEALQRLAVSHPRKSQVVEMRFFGGLSVEETAEVLGVSNLTVIRDWNFARAWLQAVMSGKEFDGD